MLAHDALDEDGPAHGDAGDVECGLRGETQVEVAAGRVGDQPRGGLDGAG